MAKKPFFVSGTGSAILGTPKFWQNFGSFSLFEKGFTCFRSKMSEK